MSIFPVLKSSVTSLVLLPAIAIPVNATVTPVDGVVHVIPELATMILLAAGGLLLHRRRFA